MVKSKLIYIPIYGLYLRIEVYDDGTVMQNKFDMEDEVLGLTTSRTEVIQGKEKGVIVVAFNNGYEGEAVTLSTIIHEAVHVKNMLFNHIGHSETKLGKDEPEAYLMEWIVATILKTIEKWKNH